MNDPIPGQEQPQAPSVWSSLLSGNLKWIAAAAIIAVFWSATSYFWRPIERDVPAQWNDAIARLGVAPIYPPTEDIQVGDVYAVITSSHDPLAKLSPVFSGRAVLIGRIDARAALSKFYGEALRLSSTNSSSDSKDGAIPKLKNSGTLFDGLVPMTELPAVLFPEFAIETSNSNSVAPTLELMGTAFGLVNSSRSTVQVKLRETVTYGLPSIEAFELLHAYCSPAVLSLRCTDKVMRSALATIIGREIFRTFDAKLNSNGKSTTSSAYVYSVQLMMISRLYLSKSVTLSNSNATANGVTAGRLRQLESAVAGAKEAQKAGEVALDNAEKRDSGLTSAQKALIRQQSTATAELARSLTDLQAGGLTATAQWANAIDANLTFSRPMAVGYRAVGFPPIDDK